MRLIETTITGVFLIDPFTHIDNRGKFIKVYNENDFKNNSLEFDFKESYFSINEENVIRGMHFQLPPCDHEKVIYVSKGKITDVVLDIRKGSPNYGKYYSVELSDENKSQIYIPKGCAHGFKSHVKDTCVVYLQTTVHCPDCDIGIKYDSFGMNWGIDNPIISERDKNFKSFKDFDSSFIFKKE